MGYTNASIEILKPHLSAFTTVCDFGAQNHHDLPGVPFISEWFESKGKEYMCIDLNGENESKKWDLSEPLKTNKTFGLVGDLGTSEHVKDLFQCFDNVNKLTKVGGLMFHENPKTGNWPNHGYHYRTTKFYEELAALTGYKILHLDEHPACWNTTDGWIIRCIMVKTKDGFIEREQFPKTYKE